jgi:hypothetical protein
VIDPITSMAVALQTSPGVYALLLGSGVSRAAGIPTGWEIVQDLVGRLATAEGEDVAGDAIGWYTAKYGVEPDYERLLEELAALPAERNRLLRAYFEPSDDDIEQGLKQPTQAHRSIAGLVKAGFVRVVITTNFDRLMERALDEAGVSSSVVCSGDDVEGLLPLEHSGCTVVKVHGDYLDTRIKNTERELGKYDSRIDTLLDHALDTHGLIVCGWSAKYDKALRTAIARCPSRRFSTYWAAQGGLGASAQRLATARQARVVSIETADKFFLELSERVTALAASGEDPTTARVAVARLKRYLPNPEARIRLHDLVSEATEDLRGRLGSSDFPLDTPPPSPESVIQRIQAYDAAADILARVVAIGAYHGTSEQESLWIRSVRRVGQNDEPIGNRLVVWDELQRYPALALAYAVGVASVSSGHFSLVGTLASAAAIDEKPLVRQIYPWKVLDDSFAKQLPGLERHHTPMSDHLHRVLRDVARDLVLSNDEYETAFDRFEYLWALLHVDAGWQEQPGRDGWGPVGRFGWRRRSNGQREPVIVTQELEREGEEWAPLRAGLFGGSLSRLQEVKVAFDSFSSRLGMAW